VDEFVHLHRHSEFSLLDGVGTADVYAKRAAELGQSALSITDHGSLAGTLYHVEACEEVGIKPILGMEGYFRQDIAFDRENKLNRDFFHLILLAKNEEGWRNLMRLSSISFKEENFYQKPCLDWRILRQYSEGLIASTTCASGIIPQAIIHNDEESAKHLLRVFRDIFGDDFYLEIQPHDFDEQRQINLTLCNWFSELGVPIVAAGDVHFPYEDWSDTQKLLPQIKTGADIDVSAPKTCWLTTREEINVQFNEFHNHIPKEFIEQALANSVEISERIEHFKIDKSPKIPKATESLEDAERILREWCEEGLERIGKSGNQVYLDRLEEEFSVLKKLKVLDYFVIVGDMVRWAKNQGIRVGPGRGSAAGCLINYLVRITAIDPIGYGLLFERFMNEYRTEIPDIDIDFQDDRRDEVKDYLRQKWGDDYVVDIAAFQSFGLKAAIKDVARVLGVPYEKANRATKAIPDKTWGLGIEDLEEQLPEIKELFNEYPDLRRHAVRLQGQIKGLSRHAAAVVVTDRPAQDVIPMMQAKDGAMVTQWSERANGQLIAPYGFLKIDCLATDALTVQDKTVKLIKERYGIDIDFEDIKQFPVNESPDYAEADVVEAFADGANIGVFQFGTSAGIKGFLKEIRPTHLEHIIAANAMYRPGPMAFLGDYAARKNGSRWTSFHESVAPYMDYTFGILVFQEQVMQLYNALAKDATGADSATFLKVVAKGIARDLEGKQRLQKYYDKFAVGCEEKGIPKTAYDKVWDQILQMSTYAFNKSHSTGYAVQAYQDKWLKVNWHYPLEFYASLLTTESDNAKKVPPILKEAKIFGIRILPPDINISGSDFTIHDNNIRFGLLGVKGVGQSAIETISRERSDNGLFESYEDFCKRVPKAKVKKNVKRNLVDAGAFDALGGREDWVIDDEGNVVVGKYSEKQRGTLETQILGYALSRKSDIDLYSKIIKDRTIPFFELEDREDGEVMLGGEIVKLKEIETKKGDKMAFVDLAFETDDYSLTFFPRDYMRFSHILSEGNAILVIGDWDKGRQSTVVKEACTAAQLAEDLKVNGR
jgi:DNA polymerase-3 subunit alpha